MKWFEIFTICSKYMRKTYKVDKIHKNCICFGHFSRKKYATNLNFEKTSSEPFFLRCSKKTFWKFQCNRVINIITMDDFIENTRRASSSSSVIANHIANYIVNHTHVPFFSPLIIFRHVWKHIFFHQNSREMIKNTDFLLLNNLFDNRR